MPRSHVKWFVIKDMTRFSCRRRVTELLRHPEEVNVSQEGEAIPVTCSVDQLLAAFLWPSQARSASPSAPAAMSL